MTISKTPRTDYRHAYRDPTTHRFTKRPAAYVEHLSDDAFPDSAVQAAMQTYRAQSVDMPPMPEPIERETWFDWRDWKWSDLWIVAFILTVLAFGAHRVGFWPS